MNEENITDSKSHRSRNDTHVCLLREFGAFQQNKLIDYLNLPACRQDQSGCNINNFYNMQKVTGNPGSANLFWTKAQSLIPFPSYRFLCRVKFNTWQDGMKMFKND